MSTIKRFIAGAVCPRCGAMDRLRTWEQNETRYRDCVSCDFFEQQAIEEPPTLAEISTRVSDPRETPASDEVQPVRILDPGKLH
ncbi:YheV family putative zinc ribbon protein [Cobetia amphilecti]|jgi:uncharacterized metal-binding protein (TIGR02443 family)|uniref:YheV family putative zinc ribbon protein n=1 Tax=Cobetia amphilecti TaxID=1055104 RepID=A0AAP4X2X3_9GAMM|nr:MULTISPECIES: YheV family putative zinc ribbon protein [Cobetia]AVV34234.1 hypothetical protein C8233_11735 [Halomonas sp. SF2003]MBR9755217.1 YheV family putative metal-binding protein [Gammaproteobacteria bacterium]TCJ24405.1 YheV family putative metal-binding protein [Halomonas sp. GDM18]KGA01286.1 hypothetical protein KP05_13805 [Cobetia amphilecti]KPM78191.1 hypothetical protein AOG28_09895 [Cobetia sp. UCD-24C]|tara:strand:- start:1060 stop:1311 length:252 start_codon:yes stop_codon:yes gene_type:complete